MVYLEQNAPMMSHRGLGLRIKLTGLLEKRYSSLQRTVDL
jgi:hypothetical protein